MDEKAIKEGAVRQNPLDCEVGDGLPDEIWGYFMHESEVARGVQAWTLFDPADPDDSLRESHGGLYFQKQSRTGKGVELVTLWVRVDDAKWQEASRKEAYAEPSEKPQA